jgi:general secretion pathway protein E
MDLEAQALASEATTSPSLSCEQPGLATAEALIAEARRRLASHLHLECSARGAVLRMRIAGRLTEPRRLLPDADLAHAFRALPSASVLALAGGERIVVRLDGGERRAQVLEAIGMRRSLVTALLPVLGGGGLVLVAGPARSGRSNTVAALLSYLASDTRHLVALGCAPVPGATHVAPGTSPTADIRQARAQDPDVIAIDTLHGREDANAAVDAVEAGILVIAGIEAGGAVAAIRQLREWRVEAFKLASTLGAVLGQRLVRRLCGDCRRPEQAQGSVSALLGFDSGAIVYAPTGCERCDGTGFAGQIGVFEGVFADGALRRLINDGGDEAILARHAFVRAPNLGSAARALVREGATTPEEAVRISRG